MRVAPGPLRADLLARGVLIEHCITVEQMLRCPRVFLLNSVRGMYRVQVFEAPKNTTDRSQSRMSSPPLS